MTKPIPSMMIHIVLNDFTNDNRVFRAASLAGKQGVRTIVFALHSPDQPETEEHTFFTVHRFKLRSRQLSRLRIVQILKYLECLIRMVWLGARLQPTIVHAHDLSALPIGYMVAKLTRAKLIYDSHELWSDSHQKSQWSASVYQIAIMLERWLARQADEVITVSEGIAQQLQQNWQLAHEPVTVKNVPDAPHIQPRQVHCPLRRSLCLADDFPVVLYQGGISSGRGLQCLIEAMQYVQNDRVHMVLLGNGPLVSSLTQQATQLGIQERVHFHQAVPAAELFQWTRDATIGVHPMEGSCMNHLLALPNKLFEYMHAGIPILVSDLPEMARVVHTHQLGRIFRDGDPRSLAAQLDEMLSNPAQLQTYANNARLAADLFNWEHEQRILESIYQKLLNA